MVGWRRGNPLDWNFNSQVFIQQADLSGTDCIVAAFAGRLLGNSGFGSTYGRDPGSASYHTSESAATVWVTTRSAFAMMVKVMVVAGIVGKVEASTRWTR